MELKARTRYVADYTGLVANWHDHYDGWMIWGSVFPKSGILRETEFWSIGGGGEVAFKVPLSTIPGNAAGVDKGGAPEAT